jgi:hypothetical protein
VKGWAVARLYPEPGLRPYGDIDLFVRPEWHAPAKAVLANARMVGTPVDLHTCFSDMPDRSPDQLYDRSQPVELNGVTVRVPGMEDHLRLLCLHLLRHGARRPLWLCDVGAILDALPADFDRAYCLQGERLRSDWVVAVLQLARELLGARLDGWSEDILGGHVPRWLVQSLLDVWGGSFQPNSSRPMAQALRRPTWLLSGARERWPNPVEAVYCHGGSTNPPSPLPFQLTGFIQRSLTFVARPIHRRP